MKKQIMVTLLATVLSSYAGVSSAMRCGTSLIDVGAEKIEVLEKCGKPLLEEKTGEVKRGSSWTRTEKWTYDMGYGQFYKIIYFEDGVVVDIRNGKRK